MKLCTVSPRFWQWPPITSLVNALERGSIFLLIGAAFFELITGLLNVAEFYPWKFFFPPAYAVAWVAIGSLAGYLIYVGIIVVAAVGWAVSPPNHAAAQDLWSAVENLTTVRCCRAAVGVGGVAVAMDLISCGGRR